jgi:hypothetical protein
MKARTLIEGASFGPDDLKIIGRAFDMAWEQLQPQFSGDAAGAEAARMRLANVILELANNGHPLTQLAEGAPPGNVPSEEMVEPPFVREAEVLVKGILAIAEMRSG